MILIVDDDPVQRILLREAVERVGLRAEEAEGGTEGIAKTRALRPDLIILDVIMPDLDGFAVCALVRGDPDIAHLPVLLVTGLDDIDSIERAFEAGATTFLTKPINLSLLGHQLKYMLRASRMELELRESMRMAQEASVAKSQFLANMSHELRTPLNAILGFSEIMHREQLGPIGTPRYRTYAQDINKSATHLLQIINDILDISKIESGKFEVHDDVFSLQQILDSVTRLMRPRAGEAAVSLNMEVDPDLPVLRSDELRLKQVLLNLVSNAVKFTPPGGQVAVRANIAENGDLIVAVADTGIGIPASEIRRVLSIFEQVDGGLNRKYEGTGLGLPLAKLITERLGGHLVLESEFGKGTRVTLVFPPSRILYDEVA
ncbi:MAG: ATP-binding protein [Kiloniellaceae bacterium]